VLDIAGKITAATTTTAASALNGGLDYSFHMHSARTKHSIVNQTNTQANIVIYWATIRRTIPNTVVGTYRIALLRNLLSLGLYEKASQIISTWDPTATNGAVFQDCLSPFDSPKFLHYVKIRRSKKITLEAGDQYICYDIDKRLRKIRPHDFQSITTSSQTWSTGSTPEVAHVQGSTFMFFKISGQVTNDQSVKTSIATTNPSVDFLTDVDFKWNAIRNTGGGNLVRPGTLGVGQVGAFNPSVMLEMTDSPNSIVVA